jgi:deoxycytidylate deaminase
VPPLAQVQTRAVSLPHTSDQEASSQPYRPDLVFALVIPVGTPTRRLVESLDSGLRGYGYDPEWIRMSDILRDFATTKAILIPDAPEDARIRALQDLGDQYCAETNDSAAVALGALVEIGARRAGLAGERPKAWILNSLKRDGEVAQLRQVYGDHVIVIGAQASRQTRKRTLTEKIAPKSPSKKDDSIEAVIDRLLATDLDSDKGAFGQNILETFPMSDVFVRCDDLDGHDTTTDMEVSRALDLLFANPGSSIPTVDEYGMYLATVAAARSPELGRKVGAAILLGDSVSALGANSHPMTPTQSPHFDRSKLDLSRMALDTLQRLGKAQALSDEAGRRLIADADGYVQSLLAGELKGSEMAALTEFQVPVHAEMAALLDALEQGKSVSGNTIYVTAYPCHGCARHILRAGLDVVYLDPYPKSRAAAMYGRDVADRFSPFTGIAPSRYMQWFSEGKRRSTADGSKIVWGHAERLGAEPRVSLLERETIEAREVTAAVRAPAAHLGEVSQTVGGGGLTGIAEDPVESSN